MTPELERDRLGDLLAEELARELSESEALELETLLLRSEDVGRDDFALAAAGLERALLAREEVEPLSEAEVDRLAAAAREYFEGRSSSTVPATRASLDARLSRLDEPARPVVTSGAILWSGWALAAVALLALFVRTRSGEETRAEPTQPRQDQALAQTKDAPKAPASAEEPAKAVSPLEERAGLLEKEGTVRLPWAHTADPISEKVAGDVVWNAHEQTGFLHFSGLERNDPKKTQYQLWIFDAKRNEAHPVDGGVFDSTGESVVIRIDPRVPVHEATLFAITIEPPGGVVVSDRKRIVVVAKPG